MTIDGVRPIELKIEVCIDKDDSGYHAYCPALKGLHTYGKTVSEARENVKYAIYAYLQSIAKHNEPLPSGVTQILKEHNCGEHYTQNLELALA